MATQTIGNLAEASTTLRQLDRREWSRLVAALFLILMLTAGIAGVSLPNWSAITEAPEMELRVQGLWGAVLLFAVFAVYQQVRIAHLRRQIASQIGMQATVEALSPPTTETQQGWLVQRRHPRYRLSRRIAITTNKKSPHSSHGHTTDVSESGLAAVLPEPFAPGDKVMLQLSLNEGDGALVIPAMVRHRRGYYHGLEFCDLSQTARESLMRAC